MKHFICFLLITGMTLSACTAEQPDDDRVNVADQESEHQTAEQSAEVTSEPADAPAPGPDAGTTPGPADNSSQDALTDFSPSYRYSMILNTLIGRSMQLDLTDEQKNKLMNMRQQDIVPLLKKERELSKLRIEMLKLLQSPDFGKDELVDIISVESSLNKEILDEFVSNITAVRDTLGENKYEEAVNQVISRDRDAVQMRRMQIDEPQRRDLDTEKTK